MDLSPSLSLPDRSSIGLALSQGAHIPFAAASDSATPDQPLAQGLWANPLPRAESQVAAPPLFVPSGLFRIQKDRPRHGHHKSSPVLQPVNHHSAPKPLVSRWLSLCSCVAQPWEPQWQPTLEAVGYIY